MTVLLLLQLKHPHKAPHPSCSVRVPPARHSLHLCRDDMGFRAGDLSSGASLRCRSRPGHDDRRESNRLRWASGPLLVRPYTHAAPEGSFFGTKCG